MRSIAPVLLLSACAGAAPEDPCRVVPVATVPLQIVQRLPVVDATVNGRPARLVFDTGASTVLITDAAAARFGSQFQTGLTSQNQNLTDNTAGRVTTETQITLAGVALKPLPIVVIPRSAVIDNVPGTDGLLGTRALDAFDLDVDLPNRRLVLHRPRRCAHGPSPLPGPSVTYPAPPNNINAMFVPARIDGRDLMMVVDTGANTTAISRDAAGLSEADLSADPATTAKSAGPGTATMRLHRFAKFEVANVTVPRPVFPTGALPLRLGGILGTDFWLRHRFWMSYPGRAITIQTAPAAAPPTR